METAGEDFRGTFVPDRRLLVAAQTVAQTTYPDFVEAIRLLSGGGLIMVPSSVADFDAARSNR